jgi:DNA polymerase
MSEVRIDFETRSDVDLRTRGAGPYFASPHFRALIAAYSIDGGPIRDWTYTQPCPADLRAHIEAGGYVRAFNASFERQCFDVLADRCGWPRPVIDRYRCTAAESAAMALPRSLESVGDALGLEIQKDKRGSALIRKFSIPRRARLNEDPHGLYWNEPEDFPEEFAEFVAYCRRDVEAEAAAAAKIVPLSAAEQAVYTLDQIINSRGIRIDRASAEAALRLAERTKVLLDQEMRIVTDGYVRKCSEPARLLEWVQNQGVVLASAQKAEITELLACDDLPPRVRRAVELRQEAAKTSVAKLQAMLNRASDDGRVRGSFLFCGASTGRWASMGVNFANLPRPRKEYEDAHLRTDILFDAFRREDPALLDFLYGPKVGRPLHLLSDAIRGFIWSAPGHDLIQADYSGIEGAVIAWSSGEDWKVQAMHEIIADPTLPDLYRRTAATIMNTTSDIITKKHPLRQSVGKVSELALGFAGGVSAFYSMSQAYGVKLEPLFGPVWETADEERRERAVRRYENSLKRGINRTAELSREAWIACELIKVGWRATNPMIAAGWRIREDAVREAIRNPGTQVSALKFKYVVKLGFLWCQLPSGRCLAYAAPRLRDQVWAEVKLPDGSWSDAEVMDRETAEKAELKGDVKIQGATSQSISALGVDKTGKKMRREPLYGGLLAENDTQATARDLLVNGMHHAERGGYPIIAHVYDEVVAEVPHGFGSVEEFEQIINVLPAWADGLPLTADGWRGKRYRK